MATTFRAAVVAALVDILEDQMAATPTLLAAVFSTRPGAIREVPMAWIGTRSEEITHDSGTRTRTFDGLTVQLVDNYTSAEQTANRLDQLVDALIDRFDANVSRIPNTIIELTSVTDNEIEETSPDGQRSTWHPGALLTFANTAIKEGRQ